MIYSRYESQSTFCEIIEKITFVEQIEDPGNILTQRHTGKIC